MRVRPSPGMILVVVSCALAVGGDGVGGDLVDLVAADEDVLRRRELGGFAVEDADVFEEGDVFARANLAQRIFGQRRHGEKKDRERNQGHRWDAALEYAMHGVASAGLDRLVIGWPRAGTGLRWKRLYPSASRTGV